MALVYALIAASNPSELRYIGKTTEITPKGRRNRHVNEAKISEESTYKLNWIRKVLLKNDKVLAIIVEDNLTEQQSFNREAYLIAYYRAYGDRLTNATLGGEGASGRKHSEESKAKMSIAKKGKPFSEEHRAKIHTKQATEAYKSKQRAAKKGKPLSEEARRNMQKISPEEKARRKEVRRLEILERKIAKRAATLARQNERRLAREYEKSLRPTREYEKSLRPTRVRPVNVRLVRQTEYFSPEWQTKFKTLPESASKREKIQAKYWLRRAESMI